MLEGKNVIVYKEENDVHRNATEFVKELQDAVDKIPEEYKSAANISIITQSCGCYNDYGSCIEIYYTCPKTAEEIKKEEAEGKRWKNKRIKYLERELEELKNQ